MDNQNSFFARWSPRVLSILRIVIAFIFVAHGSQKLFGYPAYAEAAITAATGCSASQSSATAAAATAASRSTAVAAAAISSRMAGACRRAANSSRAIHATRCVYPRRRDGRRLLHAACAEGLLAYSEHGRASGVSLFHLSVSICGWRRHMELG